MSDFKDNFISEHGKDAYDKISEEELRTIGEDM